MKRKKTFAIINIMSFLLLAFSVSFEFQDPAIELTCLLSGLVGTVVSAGYSVFNRNVWDASHGPGNIQYEGAFKLLVSIIFLSIMLHSFLRITHLLPASLDALSFGIWIVGYAAMISPNLIHIFKSKTESESLV